MPIAKPNLFICAISILLLWGGMALAQSTPETAETETIVETDVTPDEQVEVEVEAEAETGTEELQAEDEAVAVAEITGDVKKGKRVFKKCKACHKVKEGKNGAGPTLYKIIGRKSAQIEAFSYSPAMRAADLTWDVATLTEYLKKPKDYVPGTSMLFPGLKKDTDIENVIAYLNDVTQGE